MNMFTHLVHAAIDLESDWVALRDTLLSMGVDPSKLLDMGWSVESACNQMLSIAENWEEEI